MPGIADSDTMLATEILGFAPQLLIDDLVNAAIDVSDKAAEAMETHFNIWYDKHPEADAQQAEVGLTAFHTLISSTLDKALDAFEHWCLNNVFKIPPDLPIVMPHHKGLDLTVPPEVEAEVVSEIDELRRKINTVRELCH